MLFFSKFLCATWRSRWPPRDFFETGGPPPHGRPKHCAWTKRWIPPPAVFLFLLLFKVVQRSRCFFLSTRVCQVVALSSLVVNVAVEVGQLLCPVFSLRSLCVWRAISVCCALWFCAFVLLVQAQCLGRPWGGGPPAVSKKSRGWLAFAVFAI